MCLIEFQQYQEMQLTEILGSLKFRKKPQIVIRRQENLQVLSEWSMPVEDIIQWRHYDDSSFFSICEMLTILYATNFAGATIIRPNN